jgi:hypothetical protein
MKFLITQSPTATPPPTVTSSLLGPNILPSYIVPRIPMCCHQAGNVSASMLKYLRAEFPYGHPDPGYLIVFNTLRNTESS